MEIAGDLRARIEGLIASDRVVLFMKGVRGAPRCGFSATVCRILDGLLPEYATVDVLADPALREGIKQYSSWPTVPQLYVSGEFVGGCDIVQEMLADGSLYGALGVEAPATHAPAIAITAAAARALQELAGRAAGPLHIGIDPQFQHRLYFGPAEPGALALEVSGVALELDPVSAARADGLTLDAEVGADGPAFRIDNPNAPRAPEVREMDVRELAARRASEERMTLVDVRTPEERALAHIEGARLLDASFAGAARAARQGRAARLPLPSRRPQPLGGAALRGARLHQRVERDRRHRRVVARGGSERSALLMGTLVD